MIEETLITARLNPKVDPSLGIWSWEIPVYLFLGGLTAGLMFFAAWALLSGRDKTAPFAAHRMALWAPIVLSIGMTTLFLDLEHKLWVWRFYTTFQPASPMSWGSWLLIFVYPISLLQILSTLRPGYPRLAGWAERLPWTPALLDFCERHRRAIAAWSIPFAIGLGIYTGILLSAFSARPFWNTSILGPLFLISGLSAAAALAILAARDPAERHLFARIDIGLLVVELVLAVLLVIGLATGARHQLQAMELIREGPYAVLFWGGFMGLGLALPLLLEWQALRGRLRWVLIAPLLVLIGGFLLRQITVDLGQLSTWTEYATPFDPALLQRLSE